MRHSTRTRRSGVSGRAVAVLLLLGFLSGASPHARAQTTVAADRALTPTGVSPGGQFRLIFATSTNIADYNTFVQAAAEGGHSAIRACSSSLRVVGCTGSVDARDNTETTYTETTCTSSDKGVPIHWLNGNKVADDCEDFHDGFRDDEANAKDQSGNNRTQLNDTLSFPFTGCSHDGTESSVSGASRGLGADSVQAGRPNTNDPAHGPIGSNTAKGKSGTRPFYALAQVFGAPTMPPGTTLVGNDSGTGTYVAFQGSRYFAQSFDAAERFTLDSLELHFSRLPQPPRRIPAFEVTLHQESSNRPGEKVVDLTSPATVSTDGANVFEAPPDTELDAGTCYVQVRRVIGFPEEIQLATGSDDESSDSVTGWSISNVSPGGSTGTSWSGHAVPFRLALWGSVSSLPDATLTGLTLVEAGINSGITPRAPTSIRSRRNTRPRHGRWRVVHADGSVEEGCYVKGLLHGEWTLRDREGQIVAWERWRFGRLAGSGSAEGEEAPDGAALPDACRQEPEM